MEAEDDQFAFRLVILVEYLAVTAMSGISVFVIYLSLLWMWRLRKTHFEMTPCLLIYLSTLLFSNLTLAMNAAVVSSFWRPDSFASTYTIFWVGLFSGCLLGASPAGIVFLTLDRLLVIACPFRKTAAIRKGVAVGSVVTISGLFFTFLVLNVVDAPTSENG
ncbi:hypothetical protein AAVH_32685, partial [Aphelenchoides avenae]